MKKLSLPVPNSLKDWKFVTGTTCWCAKIQRTLQMPSPCFCLTTATVSSLGKKSAANIYEKLVAFARRRNNAAIERAGLVARGEKLTESAMAEPTTPFAASTALEKVTPQLLSVGIVGAGEIVSRIHLPVLSACEDIHIAYVADRNSETAQSVAGSYKLTPVTAPDDLDELPRTDVVLLAVPVTARMPYYELFAKRGTSS